MSATLLLLLAALAAESSADFPFTAEVIGEEAEIHAGNGRRFYQTDRLKRGTRVEVHRRDAGGWYAIRPPEGSFSWVPAEQVNLTDDPDVAEVTAEDTVSWIGSRVEKVRDHRYHVELKIGERLEILGEKKVAAEDGEQVWYKIAPPAGEFRWIHSRDVRAVLIVPAESPTSPLPATTTEPLATNVSPTQPSALPATGFRPRGKVELREIETSSKLAEERDLKPIRPAAFAEEAQTAPRLPAVDITAIEQSIARETSPEKKTDGFVPRGTRWNSGGSPDSRERPSSSSSPGKPPEPLPIGSGISAQPLALERLASNPQPSTLTASKTLSRQQLDSELAALDAELALMVAGDPKTWNLARLRLRGEQLIDQGESATDRGRARILVEKIHKFAETFGVEDNPRYAGIAPPTAATNDKVVGSGAREAGATSALDPKYDGQGWLKPVISHNKPAAAPFAIVDKDGKPVAFVTPTPGLNLNVYKDRRVGLYGRRGYLEALRTPHITAERVIDLDRHLR